MKKPDVITLITVLAMIAAIVFVIVDGIQDRKREEVTRAVVASCPIGGEIWRGMGENPNGLVSVRVVKSGPLPKSGMRLPVYAILETSNGKIVAVRESYNVREGSSAWVAVEVAEAGKPKVVEVIKVPLFVHYEGAEVYLAPPFLKWGDQAK